VGEIQKQREKSKKPEKVYETERNLEHRQKVEEEY